MSLEIKGSSCVRCKSYLFDEDDIVYCPVCGAPHHRECYNALGRCALEELHGTPNEYSREKEAAKVQEIKEEEPKRENKSENVYKVKCESCGEEYSATLSKCPDCGEENHAVLPKFVTFDLLGGVPADMDLGNGITAKEAKQFVLANTHKYIPKFAVLNNKNKTSWNWMSFLFPTGWFLSRKMYKLGIVAGIFTIAATLLGIPFINEVNSIVLPQNASYSEFLASIIERVPDMGAAVLVLSLLGTVVDLAVRVICALRGDFIYKQHVIKNIIAIKETAEDKDAAFRQKGGVSVTMFLLGIMAIQYIPSIIAMFI